MSRDRFAASSCASREAVDPGAVLRADVVALAHALGRVVVLPEDLEHRVVARAGRVEHDEHDLVVAGARAAHLLVGGVGGEAAGVADRGRVHAVGLPELALRAPEAAHAEHRHLVALGEGGLQRGAEHVVGLGDGHLLSAAGEGILGRRHRGLPAEQAHRVPLLLCSSLGVRAPLSTVRRRRTFRITCRAARPAW